MKKMLGDRGVPWIVAALGALGAVSAFIVAFAPVPIAHAQAAPAQVLTAETDGNQLFYEVAAPGTTRTLGGPLVITYVWFDTGQNPTSGPITNPSAGAS